MRDDGLAYGNVSAILIEAKGLIDAGGKVDI
jgi:hypothetical protein